MAISKSVSGRIAIYFAMVCVLVFCLLPFVQMFLVSISYSASFDIDSKRGWLDGYNFDAYREMWKTLPDLERYVFNSLFISGSITLINLTLSVPAAYAYARYDFPLKDLTITLLMVVGVFSGVALIMPMFRLFLSFGILHTYFAIILPGVAFTLPLAIWLMRQFFNDIPIEYEESATIDGANSIYIILKILLPLSRPGIIVVAITVFMSAYAHQFLIAYTMNKDSALSPLTVGIYQFIGRRFITWNEVMAASFMGILPVFALFFVLQSYIASSLALGRSKK